MSYETNPILNRIKHIKGWKSPTFPTKTLNYSREMVLWFKVYLFLKAYLWLQNIRLLTCEIRISEDHTKILYLSISKYITKKKNVKSKWKTKSFLQNLKSPLIKAQNKKARFLLYRDLRTLKQKSEFFFNRNRKTIFSKAWLSKPRLSSWVNFSQLIYLRRKFQIRQHTSLWKKKQKLWAHKLNWDGFQRNFRKVKNKSVYNIFEKRKFLWKKKQRNLFSLLIKLQRDLCLLEKKFDLILSQRVQNSTKSLQVLIRHLMTQYQARNFFLKQVKKLYHFCFKKQIEEPKKTISNALSKQFATNIYQQKTKGQLKYSWSYSKRQLGILQKQTYFLFSKTKRISFIKRCFWKKTLKNSSFLFLKSSQNNIQIQQRNKGPIFAQIEKNVWSRNLRSIAYSHKIRRFKASAKLRWPHVFGLLRFEQKKQLHNYKRKIYSVKKIKRKKKSLKFSQNATLVHNTKTSNAQKFSYRLSFRYHYRTNLTFTTNLKLKYLIEDLIQQYFSFRVCVKLFWPLMQFKNLKFYRLLFPEYKQPNFKTKNLPWDLSDNLNLQNERYLYVGHNTNHVKLKEQLLKSKTKFLVYERLCKRNNSGFRKWNPKDPSKKSTRLINKNKTFIPTLFSSQPWKMHRPSVNTSHVNATKLSDLWQKKTEKKNKYLALKAKIIQSQSEKRLFWVSKETFISNLTTTLTLFAKYLDPQPLADHLAKIIGATKKHALTLKLIKTVLRTVHFKRGVGYRIALIGRINGANKSRTIYLKKLNRNRPRQTFSKNVNFAMSQARATIGAFGVKIWVYS
jgi:hypothetical protein